MRQFIEFVPIALFVAVYFMTRDIYVATGILMLGVCLQVGYEYYQDKAVSKRTMMVFSVVMLAGAATLVFQDEVFIKWKPTVVNWVFSIVLIGGQLLSKGNLLKKMMGEHLTLPEHVWRNLNYGWALGFFIAGALNLIVAYGYSTDIWITYKLIGGFAITFCYLVITMVYLVKGGYVSNADEKTADSTD
ncbi:MAG: inner membrane-spanning protein YciB [Candidatus Azotimanducaceae bacterium WSBS_2022_MAG_OTU7]